MKQHRHFVLFALGLSLVQGWMLARAEPIAQTVTVSGASSVGFEIPPGAVGSTLELTLLPGDNKEFISSTIEMEDKSDTAMWRRTTDAKDKQIYTITGVFSSRQWLKVTGKLRNTNPGRGPGGGETSFTVTSPALDIDVVGNKNPQGGIDPENTEDICAAVLIPGGPLIPISISRQFTVANVTLDCIQGLPNLRLFTNAKGVNPVALPLRVAAQTLTLYVGYASNGAYPPIGLKVSGDTMQGTVSDQITLLPVWMKQSNFPTSTTPTDTGPTAEKIIENKALAYITGVPEMPQVELRLGDGSVAGLTVDWFLNVTTERSKRGTLDNLRLPAADSAHVAIDQPWRLSDYYIPPSDFFGGKCVATFRVKTSGGAYVTKESKVQFTIRGKNPLDADAKAHIVGTQGAYRFAWAMVQHESREDNKVFNQFNPSGGNIEQPDYGAPNGWGIAQLDKPLGKMASTKEVYNWKANVEKFYAELAEKTGDQNRYFDAVQRTYGARSDYEPPPAVAPGIAVDMTPLEAGVITLYNGVGACPVVRLKGPSGKKQTFKNPWEYLPNGPVGHKWVYHPNVKNYLNKVLDEYNGATTVSE